MDYRDIIKQIQNKNFKNLYVFDGEETFYTDLLTEFAENNIIDEAEKDFNMTIFYGKDTNIGDLYGTLKRYPMKANYNLVILKEAQSFDKFAELENYFKEPSPTTIFVVSYKYKKLDKRRTYYKHIAKNAITHTSEKVREDKIPEWISQYCSENGYKIDYKSSQMIAEFIGTNLSNIVNELKKLFIITLKGETITPSSIERNIGISIDYNAFELTKALSNRDINKVFAILKYFDSNKDNPPQKVIPMIYPYFNKLLKLNLSNDKSPNGLTKLLGVPPFFVNEYIKAANFFNIQRTIRAIGILREYDLKSKGLGATANISDGDILKEMIIKIIQ